MEEKVGDKRAEALGDKGLGRFGVGYRLFGRDIGTIPSEKFKGIKSGSTIQFVRFFVLVKSIRN
jgi:hypothetical protein